MLKIKFIGVLGLSATLLACSKTPDAAPPPLQAQEPAATPSFASMPAGNVAAGRKAFNDLGCIGCHTIADDPTVATATAGDPSKKISKLDSNLSTRYPEEIAMSVIGRTHLVRLGVDGSEEKDLTERMTIRELIDVVAYLKKPAETK